MPKFDEISRWHKEDFHKFDILKSRRFQQSVEALREQGADTFIEVGFGGVLSGLVRRIDKEATRACVQDRPSFEELEESWRKSDE